MRETIVDVVRQGSAWKGGGYVPGEWEDCVCWVLGNCLMPALPWMLAGALCLAVACWVMIAVGVCREGDSDEAGVGRGEATPAQAGGVSRDVGPGVRDREAGAVRQVVQVVNADPEEDERDAFDEWDRM